MKTYARFYLMLVLIVFGSLPLVVRAQTNETSCSAMLTDHVVVSRVQANMPSMLPESAPYFVQIGSVDLQDAVSQTEALQPVEPVEVMTLMGANLRMGPSLYAPSLDAVPYGTFLQADAVSRSGWLRVAYAGKPAWISYATLEANPEIDALPRLLEDVRTPMQDFYLKTGDDAFCGLPSVLVIQAVDGTFVDIKANGADIEAQTTVALRVEQDPHQMQLIVLEGAAWLDGFDGAVIQGCFVTVPLSEDGHSLDGNWGDLQPLSADDFAAFSRLTDLPDGMLDHPIPLMALDSWVTPNCAGGNPFADQVVESTTPTGETNGSQSTTATTSTSNPTTSGNPVSSSGEVSSRVGGRTTTSQGSTSTSPTGEVFNVGGAQTINVGVQIISPTGNGAPVNNGGDGTGDGDDEASGGDGVGGSGGTGGSGGGNGTRRVVVGQTIGTDNLNLGGSSPTVDGNSDNPTSTQTMICEDCQYTEITHGTNNFAAPQEDGPPIECDNVDVPCNTVTNNTYMTMPVQPVTMTSVQTMPFESGTTIPIPTFPGNIQLDPGITIPGGNMGSLPGGNMGESIPQFPPP